MKTLVVFLHPHLPTTPPPLAHTQVVWTGEELGAKFEYRPIRDELKEQAAEYREMLLDAVVELDDDVMEAYLEVCVWGVTVKFNCAAAGQCMVAAHVWWAALGAQHA